MGRRLGLSGIVLGSLAILGVATLHRRPTPPEPVRQTPAVSKPAASKKDPAPNQIAAEARPAAVAPSATPPRPVDPSRLEELLAHSDSARVMEGLELLRRCTDPDVLDKGLRRVLDSGASWAQLKGLDLVLEKRRADLIPEVLVLLASRRDPLLAGRAAEVLGGLGEARSIEPLAKTFEGGDLRMQRQAGAALRQLGRPEFATRHVDAVLALLQAPQAMSRLEAVAELRTLRDAAYVPRLAAATLDTDAFVRCQAALAIADFGGSSQAPTLQRLLADPDAEVRTAAERGLRRMSPR